MPKKKAFKKDWSKVNDKIKNRKKKFTKDERLFEPTYNDKNQSKVIMRFLDCPDESLDLPYVEVFAHFFKDSGGWLIGNCPTTIHGTGNGGGGICPVCDDLYANDYYNTDNDLYYERKKKTSYYVNALIVEDKNNTENEGKVIIYKFGTKIMDKIDDLIEEGKVAWDDDCGVNFIFSAKRNGKQTSYDASRFSDVETSISDYGDEDEILDSRHNIDTFLNESEYKSYDDLKKQYEKVIGESASAPTASGKKRKPKVAEEDEILDETDIDDDFSDNDLDDDMFSDGDDDDEFFDDLDDK